MTKPTIPARELEKKINLLIEDVKPEYVAKNILSEVLKGIEGLPENLGLCEQYRWCGLSRYSCNLLQDIVYEDNVSERREMAVELRKTEGEKLTELTAAIRELLMGGLEETSGEK